MFLLAFSIVWGGPINDGWSAGELDGPPIASGAMISVSLQEAQGLVAKKKWEEAIIAYRTILRTAASNGVIRSVATAGLVKSLVFSGRREEAVGILLAAYDKERGPFRRFLARRIRVVSQLFFTQQTYQLYQDGLNLLIAKKSRVAMERFQRALQKEPDNVKILTRLGQLHVEEGDYDTAAEFLKQAKRLDPFESTIGLWLGRAMHQRGEVREAVEQLRSSYVDLRESELAPIWYAEALVSSGQRDLAVQILEDHSKARVLHLQVILALVRMKVLSFTQSGDSKSLWMARKQLQLLLSRLPAYEKALKEERQDSDLGAPLAMGEKELQAEAEKLMAQIEPHLERSGENPE